MKRSIAEDMRDGEHATNPCDLLNATEALHAISSMRRIHRIWSAMPAHSSCQHDVSKGMWYSQTYTFVFVVVQSGRNRPEKLQRLEVMSDCLVRVR